MEQSETSAEKTEITAQESAKPSLKRHVTKRNAWIAGGLILLIIVASLLMWRSRRMSYTKEFTIEGWHAVSVQSDDIAGLTKGDADLAKTTSLAAALRKLDGTMKDQKISLSLIPLLLNDSRAISIYKNFTSELGAYTSQLASMSDDVTAITDDDLAKTERLAASALDKTAVTKKELTYLSEEVNSSLFKTGNYLEALKKLSDDEKAKIAAEAKSKKQQADQDVLDKQLVESAITGFMDGYISGDATKMKRYMTPAFITEYNFTYLSADSRKYTYPASYRVVSNAKANDASYTVQVNVLNKYRNTEASASDQYTNSYSYSIIYVSASGRWLINTEKSM